MKAKLEHTERAENFNENCNKPKGSTTYLWLLYQWNWRQYYRGATL